MRLPRVPKDEPRPPPSRDPAAARVAWIPPALARARAQRIGTLRYGFDLRIDANARALSGQQWIDVELDRRGAREALVLDWQPAAGEAALAAARRSLRVNGEAAAPGAAALRAGHLVLAPQLLSPGTNRIELAWQAPIRAAGSALTRFRDPVDGALYVYTLWVPADASSVFACFDQPDLKARFTLALTVPAAWQAISNAPLATIEPGDATRRFRFAPTEPISTYLFAFAAGPFVRLASRKAPGALWVRRSQASRARAQRDEILRLNQRAVRACARYFGHRFPFTKYDLVAIPALPYRGMEHAGATFLAEKDVLLPAKPGPDARWQRAQLIGHETAHQWAGNLVTMRSFDDLWLKEGFANFIAYRIAGNAHERAAAQIAFHRLKVQAYQTDQSPGATALHQPLADMAQAKSAYGSIVYAKAPALLRQLESELGSDPFARGVRLWMRRHACAASEWTDLVRALEASSGRSLRAWARAWILSTGVPRLRASLRTGRGGVRVLQVEQGIEARPTNRPLRIRVDTAGRNGRIESSRTVSLDRARTAIRFEAAQAGADHVVLNADDSAYVILTGDARWVEAAGEALARMRSPLHRIQTWESLWQAVRDRVLDPARFAMLAIARLGAERNALVVSAVLARLESVERLLEGERSRALAGSLDAFLLREVRNANETLRRTWLEGLAALARTPAGWELMAALAHGKLRGARAGAAALRRKSALMLVLRGAWPRAQALRAIAPGRERAADFHLQLEAARPDAAAKHRVFERYLVPGALPDDAIAASLELCNHPAHAALTLRLLGPALRALPGLYQRRKIFFVNRWIGAFAGGQCSERARQQVQRILRVEPIDPAIGRKLLEADHELALAIAIRRSWPDSLFVR